jgi:outer membrane protein assembly factor BamB
VTRSSTTIALLAALLAAPNLPSQRELPDRGRLFSLPRSQDDSFEWNEARQEIEAGRHAEAVERLHLLLARGRQGVVPLDAVGEYWLGLRAAVIRTLRDLPAEGIEAYEKLVQREGASWLERLAGGARVEDLTAVATLFPTSTEGRKARRRLGDLLLCRGDGLGALRHYLEALDATPLAADDERRALELRRVAARCISVEGQIDPAQLPPPQRALADELAAAITTSAETRAFLRGWPAYGGGGDGSRQMRAHVGRLELRGSADHRPRAQQLSPYSMHAVGGLSGIYLNDGVSVIALDPLTGTELWRGDGPLSAGGVGTVHEFEDGINKDTILSVALGDDVAVAALMVPTEAENVVYRQSIPVIKKIPVRRLFAYERATGKLLWSHWDREEGPITRRFAGHDAAGPPVVHGDTVFAPTHDQTGAIAYYAAAYDLRTGTPRWRRLICSSQQEVNMFGNAQFEFAAGPLAVQDGVLLGCTNLGVCYAVDAADGDLRWVTAYPVIPLPRTQLTHQVERDVFFAGNPMVVADGVVACTPLDSMYALGIDVQSGRLLWRLDYRAQMRGANDIRWLLGAHRDEFVFSGRGIVAVRARPGDELPPLRPEVRLICSPERVGMGGEDRYWVRQIARGALADGLIYFPSVDHVGVFDMDGNSDARANEVRQGTTNPGNLLLADGLLVSLRGGPVEIYFSQEGLLAHAEGMVRRNADDPSALLALATLLRVGAGQDLLGAKAELAEKRFRQGLDLVRREGIAPSAPIHQKLARGLFELELARARWLSARQPREALARLRQARDQAPDPASWLEAQDYVLDLVQEDREQYLAELARMAAEHGDRTHDFPGIGRIPVQVFALWQQGRHAPPARAMRACQELLERWADVPLGAGTAGGFALDRQRELLAEHGAEVYAAIENAAADELRAAHGQPDRLREIALRYPLARAARAANLELIDLALARGDHPAALRAWSESVRERDPDPGIVRRTIEAARGAGNAAFARALAARLLEGHGATASDFAPDQKQSYRDALGGAPWLAPETPPAPARPSQLPFDVVARLDAPAPGVALRVRRVAIVPGFGEGPRTLAETPLYVAIGGELLAAYDLAAPAPFAAPLFELPIPSAAVLDERLWLCGTTLIVTENARVRGVDHRTGEPRWSHEEPNGRILTSLGVQDGVLHLFSQLANAGDGGLLLGLEPATGAPLFRHVYPALRECTPPAIGAGRAWVLDVEGDAAALTAVDATSGRPAARVPLTQAVLRALRLEPADLRGRRGRAMLRDLIADATGLYLPVEESAQLGPRVAAIGYDGTLRWHWTGTANRQLVLFARHGDRLLLLESGIRSGRHLQLDVARGQVLHERAMREKAHCLNWKQEQPPSPAPPALLLADTDGTENLTCIALDPSLPSFVQALHQNIQYVAGAPVLGDGFLAVLGGHRLNNQVMVLQVFDLATRISMLPAGRQLRTLDLQQGRLAEHGPAILVHSYEGLALLGPGRTTDR